MDTNEKGAHLSLNSVSSLFGDSFKLYKERFSTLTEIVLLPVLVLVFGYALLILGSLISIVGLLVVIAGFVIFVFAAIASIIAINHHVGVDSAYRASTKFFWPILWISILSGLAVFGGMVMLVLPGIWLAIALTFKGYTVVLENRRGLDSLRQSKDYVKGYWWGILGRTILLFIMMAVISIVIHLVFGIVSTKLAALLVQLVMMVFIVPFSVTFYYMMYENLRALKPHVHTSTRNGGGFVKVAAIVGLIAIVFFAVVLVSVGVNEAGGRNMNFHYNYNWHYQPSNQ